MTIMRCLIQGRNEKLLVLYPVKDDIIVKILFFHDEYLEGNPEAKENLRILSGRTKIRRDSKHCVLCRGEIHPTRREIPV